MDISDLERMGRRRFMENLAGVGVSAAALQNLAQDELSEVTPDPEEEIPYIARWENVGRAEDGTVLREPVYDTIPREKWERQEATDDALEQVGAILDGEAETNPSLIFTGAEHSPTEYGVQIRTQPGRKTEIEDLLPTEVPGVAHVDGNPVREAKIPIDVIESELELQGDAYDGQLYDEIPAAAPIVAEGSQGTITGAFSSDQYGMGWVTAGHVVEANDTQVLHEIDDINGSEGLGWSKDHTTYHVTGNYSDPEVDTAFITSSNGHTPRDWMASDDYSDPSGRDVTGIVTDSGLNDHVNDEDWNLFVQGRMTGREPTHIDGVIKNSNGDIKAIQLEYDHTDTGDSGGPIFLNYGGNSSAICGGHVGLYSASAFDDNAIATTAETIEEELGGYFIQ